MTRLLWVLAGAVLVLTGWEMLLRNILDWAGWFPIGVGAGMAVAVIGSLAHDALAGSRERL